VPQKGRIGPVVPAFNRRNVAKALAGNPTATQRDCLKAFFEALAGGVTVPYIKIPSLNVRYVGVCGHVVELRYDDTWVEDIQPGYLPP